jgi:hypothetical protein
MSTFDTVVIAAALCGVVMVGGGIALLWKGAITLAATPEATALSIEFKKQFRMNTQVPGIAFFVVGLVFIVVALYASKPTGVVPIDLQGEVLGVKAPVSVGASTKWHLDSFSSGAIRGRIYPEVTTLVIEVSAPGYVPVTTPIEIKPGIQQAVIGKFQLEKRIDEIPANPGRIAPVQFKPPPINTKGAQGFGAPQ